MGNIKFEVNENTFRNLVNQIIRSQRFKDILKERIDKNLKKSGGAILKEAYDKGYNDGINKGSHFHRKARCKE